jgi:hypothetical protein
MSIERQDGNRLLSFCSPMAPLEGKPQKESKRPRFFFSSPLNEKQTAKALDNSTRTGASPTSTHTHTHTHHTCKNNRTKKDERSANEGRNSDTLFLCALSELFQAARHSSLIIIIIIIFESVVIDSSRGHPNIQRGFVLHGNCLPSWMSFFHVFASLSSNFISFVSHMVLILKFKKVTTYETLSIVGERKK